MIMAGRGRRLGDLGVPPTKAGTTDGTSDEIHFDLPTIIEKINDLNLQGENDVLINKIQNSVKHLCSSKKELEDVFSQLYNKGLDDSAFGEKVFALKDIFEYEVNGQMARNQFLTFMQNDFNSKDSMVKSDHKKFLNAIVLLGNAYQSLTICGHSIMILGGALIEYLELLLKSEEEEDFKVLAGQIVQNGKRLSKENSLCDNYSGLHHNLRDALVNKNLNNVCKNWILFSLDFMSNDFKPLPVMLKNFYTVNLGDDYSKFESVIEKQAQLNQAFSSLQIAESPNSSKTSDGELKKDEPKKTKLPDSNSTKSSNGTKSFHSKNSVDKKKGQHNDKGKGVHKVNSSFVHDDRFEKEENFYGVQTPRPPKTDISKKNFQTNKVNKKKESEGKSKTGDGDSKKSQLAAKDSS